MNAAIEVRDLTCGYGSKSVLSNLDFEIQTGEIISLVGPNGGGKSTLLNVLGGTLPALQGEVLCFGERLGQMSASQIAQKVAFVPQDESWSFSFTARQIVAMGRLARSSSYFESEEDLEWAERALSLTQMSEFAGRVGAHLSGGERQRLLIARALAQDTPIVLFDEPTSHQDVAHRDTFIRLVLDLRKAGKTSIIAMHDLALAYEISDRAALVYAGGISPLGTPSQSLSCENLQEVFRSQFEMVKLRSGREIPIHSGLLSVPLT